MQWKRLVDHLLSPAAGCEWFIAWLYVACGGAAGTGVPLLLYLPSYDSLGVVGYIAWEYGRALVVYQWLKRETARRDLVPL
jgi:hypothetical protein